MTASRRPKPSAVTADQAVELYGPDDDGWYSTRAMDWIALCEQLRDGEVRGYLVLRSLVIDKFKAHVRVVTLQLLCELIPSPSGGPSSLTRVRSIIAGLTSVGLLTTPDGKPIKTSSRATASRQPLRIRVNDAAPKGYGGWRNTEHKLKSLGAVLTGLIDTGPRPHVQDGPDAGRIPDPPGSPGRIPDPGGRESDPGGRIPDPVLGSELRESEGPMDFPSGSSLLPATSGRGGAPLRQRGERKYREAKRELPEAQPPQASTRSLAGAVRQAWETGFSSTGRLPLPKRAAAVEAEAATLIAAGHCPNHLSRVAEWMGRAKPTWRSLENSLTWPEAPAGQKAVPSQRSRLRLCELHPAFAKDDCPPCRLAERRALPHRPTGTAGIDGASLLARARSTPKTWSPLPHDPGSGDEQLEGWLQNGRFQG